MTPQKLVFHVSKTIREAVERARDRLARSAAEHEVSVLAFKHFGKNAIKRYQLGPDSFVQNAIQLAYYRHQACHRATYESAQTRKFYHGRTETVRSCTNESIAWIRTMTTNDPSRPARERYEALQKAVARHTVLMNLAIDGQGVDRHLLGLRLLMLRENGESAAIFDDPTYALTSHWSLSTSQLSSEYFENKGWGEVVPDGFGIGYMIREESLHFNVASRYLGSHELSRHLERALLEMSDICQQALFPSQL